MRDMIAVLLILIFAISAVAGSYTTGSIIKPFALSYQHGRLFKIDKDTKEIIFVSEMPTRIILHMALQSHDRNFLLSRSAICITGISKMPSVITRCFACRNFVNILIQCSLTRIQGMSQCFREKRSMLL